MATIADYFNSKTLQLMQETFTTVLGVEVCVCAPDGQRILRDALDPDPPQQYLKVPVKLEKEVIGLLVMREPPPEMARQAGANAREADLRAPKWITDFLKLMAAMLSSLCKREHTLRLRVDELSTMYRLTAEFTGRRELSSVLTTVAATVVQLLDAKACTIRLLTEDGKELRMAAANNVIDDRHLVRGSIPLEDSKIDQEVIATKRMVYIPDLEHDSRVLFPEGAKAEGLVSALCTPLVYRGAALGVVRAYKATAYKYDRFEHALMFAIAAQAAAAIMNARLYERAVAAATMKRQIRLAGDVQQRMFPRVTPALPGMDIATVYEPCFELGGDFFDFIDLADARVGLAVCDVVGKGVRASLLMASIRAALRAHATSIRDASEVIRLVNVDLCAMTEIADFATLFYGILDAQERSITYVNAGHPAPLLFRQGRAIELTTDGGLLGVSTDWDWPSRHAALDPGDLLLAYTDGLTEMLNFQDEAFGRWRVVQAVEAALAQGMNANGVAQHVLWEMRRFAGLQTRLDDLTMVAVKVVHNTPIAHCRRQESSPTK